MPMRVLPRQGRRLRVEVLDVARDEIDDVLGDPAPGSVRSTRDGSGVRRGSSWRQMARPSANPATTATSPRRTDPMRLAMAGAYEPLSISSHDSSMKVENVV